MNCTQANEKSIISYLSNLGIAPDKVKNDSYSYLSPFRKETIPSFNVNNAKNVWFDFGTGEGGKLIQLVCKLNNCSVTEALRALSNSIYILPTTTFNNMNPKKETSESLEIIHIQKVQNKALLHYLASRNINIDIAKLYLQEIYYSVNKDKYFSLSFTNDSGGYELRNRFFKNCTSPKNITSFFITSSTELNLFEGFFDFLSYLTYYNIHELTSSSIILNSVIFLAKVKPLLINFHKINCYFDNDTAGKSAYNELKKENKTLVNKSEILYPNYKDFNDFINK